MRIRRALLAGLLATSVLSSGMAMGQTKPACDQQGKASTPAKVEGQVVNVDHAAGKVTIREADGKNYEFHADKATLQNLKIGDRLEAKLRAAPTC
jgi:Cu/Ag efflux protein CusF